MTSALTPWQALATLLAPPGEHIETDPTWSAAPTGAAAWGRGPLPAGTTLTRALRLAVARERALARVRRRAVALHRLPPPQLGPLDARERVRRMLLGGAVVVLAAQDPPLAAAMRAAGIEPTGRLLPGSGGGVLVRGSLAQRPVVLRVGVAGSAADPRGEAEALALLAANQLVPTLRGSGVEGPAAWLLADALPGRRPAALTPDLLDQVAEALATLPAAAGPPTAHRDDLDLIADVVPAHAAALRRLRDHLDIVLAQAPAVLRHGDCWTGNLLVVDGQLTALLDWDAWHPRGLVGADLVQLLATARRRRTPGEPLGRAWAQRPQDDPGLQRHLAALWERAGARLDPALLDALALAWWATEAAGTLRRLPVRAADAAWVRANVEPVLAAVSRTDAG